MHKLRRWQIENMLASRYTPGPEIERMLRRRHRAHVCKLVIGIVLVTASVIGAWVLMSWQASAAFAGVAVIAVVQERRGLKKCRR